MRFWAAILTLAVLVLPASALGQTRRAFIAAVGDYHSLTDLQKTLGDAQGYAEVFRDNLKFQVTQAPANATRAQFNAAFGQFLASIRPGDEVAFIFSGHGWSDGVENYLALSDAPRDASEFELRTETLALTTSILAQINARRPKLTLVIIDACRDNPFDNGTKAGFEKGMVRTEVTAGTMVVYAAGQRQKALDRLSTNDNAQYSLFTRVLLPKLRDPALPLMTSVDLARDEVERLAGTVKHPQRPAVYSDVSLSFCFAGTCKSTASPDADTVLWIEITSNDPACTDYERYRQQFPNGKYASQADRILTRAPCSTPRAASADTVAHDTVGPGRDNVAPGATVAAAPSSPPAGEAFRDCSDCPEMVSIPAGSFMMGSPASEAGRMDREGPQRRVTLPAFAAGKYEVTVGEYLACVSAGKCSQPAWRESGGEYNVSTGTDEQYKRLGAALTGTANPIVGVSWNDAKKYVAWLNSKVSGSPYRLLSEAEWEYAARSGSSTRWSFGDDEDSLETHAWYLGNSVSTTHPVGRKEPNAFGLHDMHGNVWEWVEDCSADSYSAGQTSDGRAYTSGACPLRVIRGGDGGSFPEDVRSATRNWFASTEHSTGGGFRVARTL
jgi:formylglycine-generating enzyme required for sulfatase activity